jgi:ABC-type polysaccharide/polyol phosphate export permease
VRYKQSILGVGWAIIQPLTMMFIFTIVFSRFAALPSEGVPYPVFSYAALLPWTFFASAVSNAIGSLVGNAMLIKKLYFPRVILPLAAILTYGLDFVLTALVFVVLLAYYRVSVTMTALYVLPLVGLQLAFMLGVSLILASLKAYYRDVRYALPMLMQVWLYATPVVWSMRMVPVPYRIPYVLVNPMAAVIDGIRGAVLHGTPPEWALITAATASTVAVLLVGYRYFTRVQRTFADVI